MIGLEFEAPLGGQPKMKGEVVLTSILGVSLKHSKWWDLGAVAGILLVYRVIFLLVVKLKERAVPLLHSYYTNRTLTHLSSRPSFRITLPFPSARHHHVPHPLSSQEGLNSPLQN